MWILQKAIAFFLLLFLLKFYYQNIKLLLRHLVFWYYCYSKRSEFKVTARSVLGLTEANVTLSRPRNRPSNAPIPAPPRIADAARSAVSLILV
ncbi:MAG: hypothetical protein ACK54E_13775 [Pseudanabaena sp.]|nr:hypothetical protein [Pseudanabaena sp. M090S1SP2A07QC]MCA6507728.1 hypothetical protein [Pseudanabaena sp. M172S2SP2A07QC]MCA6518489.1 hypothetical protein [Pseudanabaena sp. M110S1SP2A07QC]MCA6521047.1 hypothetical protein [Pseudanabaena sp. M051S1SP2A07QC]MCA6528266.1 hypothetical protein [Pseudanabaena sp. M179S2SP2A07QC]MCA6532350.1 hypothetical protein [Pseudanabaena sp. M125S2SP2A07QC]MCA6536518.1 hypothetical protein [Pseudanabaena sp. M176S2SP2A07QC]MCA6537617.1 hypothetical prot